MADSTDSPIIGRDPWELPNASVWNHVALIALAGRLRKDDRMEVWWRVAGDGAVGFVRSEYVVDYPVKRGGNDPANDDYAWIMPVENQEEAQPFPELGKDDCDLNDYSRVMVNGSNGLDIIKQPSLTSSRRQRPSSRAGGSHRDPSTSTARDGYEDIPPMGMPPPGLAAALAKKKSGPGDKKPSLKDQFYAEDPEQWAALLCTADPATNQLNLRELEEYYADLLKTFTAKQRESIENVMADLKNEMTSLKMGEAFATTKWIENRREQISKLDLVRMDTQGLHASLIEATGREYKKLRVPQWMAEVHNAAAAFVKIQGFTPHPKLVNAGAALSGGGGGGGGGGGQGGGGGASARGPTRSQKKTYNALKDKKISELTAEERKKLGMAN